VPIDRPDRPGDTDDHVEVGMSFERPGLDDKHGTVSDSDLNDALENDKLEKGRLEFDEVAHEEGERSPGPEPLDGEGLRPPQDQDVAVDQDPVEPPD
jgi:hypothetical protein